LNHALGEFALSSLLFIFINRKATARSERLSMTEVREIEERR